MNTTDPRSQLPLIIFDVDGTLVGGESNDWSAFGEAYRQVTGTDLDLNLFDRLNEVTAHSIISAALAEAGETNPLPVIAKIAAAYADILAGKIAAGPGAFDATDGAVELLSTLPGLGYDCAIATGDWYKSITLKLDEAGLPWRELPIATSSDRPTRAATIALAAERAGRPITEAVYVGDGTWDFRATQTLGIPFIGVGSKQAALIGEGARFLAPSLAPAIFFPVLEQTLASRMQSAKDSAK